MDERTIQLAKQYMKKASENIPKTDRLPVKLPESQQQSAAVLLGIYGAMVESRDMELQLDEGTLAKVDKVVKWMYESRKRGLLLCGTLGNGKTTMLRSLKQFFGMKASYYEAQVVYDCYRQNRTFPQNCQNEILLLDDLGVEPATYNDFGEIRYPLAEFLMKRYKNNLPTIIATNLTFEDIGKVYGDRLQDRMREMFAMITYKEQSYRR